MKILLTGAQGQVGQAVQQVYANSNDTVIALDRQALDITNPTSVDACFQKTRPDVVINAAAYTAVDNAETDSVNAYLINCNGPGFLAGACEKADIPLIHISTDFVFSGAATIPYKEDDETDPVGKYGMSKRAGEDVVASCCKKHITLRTSWVFGGAQNFVATMLRLAETRDELSVVDDQIGGPTAALDIAHAIQSIVGQCTKDNFSEWGIYHYSGAPAVSWCDFAKAIFAGRDKPVVHPIATSEYPTLAKRPAYSVLDCSRIKKVFGVNQPDWKKSLQAVLKLQSGS